MNMGYDDNAPIILQMLGWEKLADGREQLLVVCNTPVDFATMPKNLEYGPTSLRKIGWDPERRVAFYRDGEIEDLLDQITIF